MQYKTKIQYQEYIAHQGPSNFEHIFSAILKTVHSDRSNNNKQLTVSIDHNMGMYFPKLFNALSLIQSNTYYQKK